MEETSAHRTKLLTLTNGVESSDPPPPMPPHFDERYVLPQHFEKRLQSENAHPMDERIVFFEGPHVYTFDGFPAGTSVTTVAHQGCEEFNPAFGIAAMKKSTSQPWPRYPYVNGIVPVYGPDCLEQEGEAKDSFEKGGVLLYHAKQGKTLCSLWRHNIPFADGGEACYLLWSVASLKGSPIFDQAEGAWKWYAFSSSMTDDEIKASWERKGLFARNEGTEAHYQMERMLNGMSYRKDQVEVQLGVKQMIQLLDEGKILSAYRTEWEVYASEEDVAGSVDAVFLCPDGTYRIVDWKRSAKLKSNMRSRKMREGVLSHLDDCDGTTYTLQLSLYQFILEKYYGLTISGRTLVSVHPEGEFRVDVPYLGEEAGVLMAKRRQEVEVREVVAKRRPDLCCERGRLITDPVMWVGTKTMEHKKVALLKKEEDPTLSFVEEGEEVGVFRSEVEDLVKKESMLVA